MRRSLPILPILMSLLAIFLLAACGGESENESSGTSRPTPAPDTEAGRGYAIFNDLCDACHVTQGSREMVGPSLDGVAQKAGDRVDGQSAEEYLHESIVKPDAYVVDGYQPGIMPQNLGEQFTSEEINQLVAYLMTLD